MTETPNEDADNETDVQNDLDTTIDARDPDEDDQGVIDAYNDAAESAFKDVADAQFDADTYGEDGDPQGSYMTTCDECGATIPSRASFCETCGEEQTDD